MHVTYYDFLQKTLKRIKLFRRVTENFQLLIEFEVSTIITPSRVLFRKNGLLLPQFPQLDGRSATATSLSELTRRR